MDDFSAINFKTDSTEIYDLSYQYGIDCLTAGLRYRREFYQDVDDIEPIFNPNAIVEYYSR